MNFSGLALYSSFASRKAGPGCVELDEHLIRDFGRKCFVGICRFKQGIERCIVSVFPLEKEGLAHMIIREVPHIFGSICEIVDRAKRARGNAR